MSDERSPEEIQTALVATTLFSKRADGHIEMLSPQNAAAFLGAIDSYNTGQGSFNLLVPKTKIHELGLNQELWDRVGGSGREHNIKGREYYDIDCVTGFEFISRLEVISGKKWSDMRAVKEAVDASRETREIG